MRAGPYPPYNGAFLGVPKADPFCVVYPSSGKAPGTLVQLYLRTYGTKLDYSTAVESHTTVIVRRSTTSGYL